MTKPTIPQLEAELERARQEIGALRDLLDAVVQAKLPYPAQDAGMDDWSKRDYESARRLDHVAAWADVSRGTSNVIRSRAAEIRSFCQKPLRYKAEEAAR